VAFGSAPYLGVTACGLSRRKRSTNDVVAPGKVPTSAPPPRTSTTLFLQVVAFAADVGNDFESVGQAATLRGTVSLLRGGGVVHTGANTATPVENSPSRGFGLSFSTSRLGELID
jgi:hypothetical protein